MKAIQAYPHHQSPSKLSCACWPLSWPVFSSFSTEPSVVVQFALRTPHCWKVYVLFHTLYFFPVAHCVSLYFQCKTLPAESMLKINPYLLPKNPRVVSSHRPLWLCRIARQHGLYIPEARAMTQRCNETAPYLVCSTPRAPYFVSSTAPPSRWQTHISLGIDDMQIIQSLKKCGNILLLSADEAGVGDRLGSG